MKRSPAAMLLALLVSMMPTALGAMVRRVSAVGFGHEATTGLLQAGDIHETSRFASRSQIAMLSEEALRRLEDNTNYALYGGIGVLVLAGIGGAAFVLKRKGEEKEDVEAREVKVVVSGKAASADMDAEKLMKTVAKRAVQMVGPKLAKANMVRGILESHVYGFPHKAQAFLSAEMYNTVGAVLKEMEAEEAMVLFGMGADGSISVPPASVLLAGLLSPVVLTVSFIVHLSQVVVVLIPVACMCAWAVWLDNTNGTLNSCAVPGLWLWMYAMGALATILAIAHSVAMGMIASGKAQIRAKADEMRDEIIEAVGDGELSVAECRKLFLVSSVLLEHALMVEDNLRRSIWRNVIGLGTIAWFLLTIWNFFIVLVYTFVPGVVAFHESAREVAGDDFCGAWASVLTARVTCVLALLFVVFNMMSILQYISDKLVTNESYFKGVLDTAKKFDNSSIGVPVMQVMAKAFLLRGNSDTLASHITQASDATSAHEKERDRLQHLKESLEARIQGHKSEASQLRKEMGIPEEPEAEAGPSWSDKAKEAGESAQQAVEDAKAKAAEIEKVTREELDNLIKKIMAAAEQVRNSEAVRQAIEQAEKAKEQAEEAARMAQDPEVRARLYAEAQEAAEKAAQAGLAQARELSAQAQELGAQAQEAASSGLAQAQQAAEQLAASPEVQKAREQAEQAIKAGAAAAKEGVRAGEEAAEKASKEVSEAAKQLK